MITKYVERRGCANQIFRTGEHKSTLTEPRTQRIHVAHKCKESLFWGEGEGRMVVEWSGALDCYIKGQVHGSNTAPGNSDVQNRHLWKGPNHRALQWTVKNSEVGLSTVDITSLLPPRLVEEVRRRLTCLRVFCGGMRKQEKRRTYSYKYITVVNIVKSLKIERIR